LFGFEVLIFSFITLENRPCYLNAHSRAADTTANATTTVTSANGSADSSADANASANTDADAAADTATNAAANTTTDTAAHTTADAAAVATANTTGNASTFPATNGSADSTANVAADADADTADDTGPVVASGNVNPDFAVVDATTNISTTKIDGAVNAFANDAGGYDANDVANAAANAIGNNIVTHFYAICVVGQHVGELSCQSEVFFVMRNAVFVFCFMQRLHLEYAMSVVHVGAN
jgi:hypothetical protein